MNKKRVFLLLLVFILPFMFVINAKAEEYESIEKYICSESNKYKLINKVSKVKLSYEFISELTKEEIDSGYGPYFKVKVANMPEDVTLKMDAYTYTLKKDGDYYEVFSEVKILQRPESLLQISCVRNGMNGVATTNQLPAGHQSLIISLTKVSFTIL